MGCCRGRSRLSQAFKEQHEDNKTPGESSGLVFVVLDCDGEKMLEENELFHDGAIHSPGGYLPTCHSCFLFHVFLTQHPHPRKKRNVSMSQASSEDRFLTATFSERRKSAESQVFPAGPLLELISLIHICCYSGRAPFCFQVCDEVSADAPLSCF